MEISGSSTSSNKKKRLANTTREQYEEYLNYIEKDDIFRSGVTNPTVADNYLNDKWKELTNILNSKAKGPELSAESWKKRFADWKNSVRHKYRKYIAERGGTGRGPEIENPLNESENRAIDIWGRITVEGCKGVPEIFRQVISVPNESIIIEEIEIENDEVKEPTAFVQKENKPVQGNKPVQKEKQIPNKRLRELNILGEKMLNKIEHSTAIHTDLVKALQDLADSQKDLLKFKIAAFKHKNPDFEY